MKSRSAVAVPTALTAATLLCTVLALGGQRKAEAFPPFSKKEKKPCSYCHVNPAGGGKRTAAAKPAAKPAVKPTAAKKPTKPAAPKKPARKGGSPPPKKG